MCELLEYNLLNLQWWEDDGGGCGRLCDDDQGRRQRAEGSNVVDETNKMEIVNENAMHNITVLFCCVGIYTQARLLVRVVDLFFNSLIQVSTITIQLALEHRGGSDADVD